MRVPAKNSKNITPTKEVSILPSSLEDPPWLYVLHRKITFSNVDFPDDPKQGYVFSVYFCLNLHNH